MGHKVHPGGLRVGVIHTWKSNWFTSKKDFPAALMKLSWRERGLVLRDLWRFVLLYKEFKWGRRIALAAAQRLAAPGYPGARWL